MAEAVITTVSNALVNESRELQAGVDASCPTKAAAVGYNIQGGNHCAAIKLNVGNLSAGQQL